MKFNWRANWEILLVLVIIVVGIVITTIAAIKNKDKHLLTLPEETDFGQLLAGSGLSEAQNNSLPVQQTDLQFTGDVDDQPTRRPHATSQVKSARGVANQSGARDQLANNGNGEHRATGLRQSKFDDNDYVRLAGPDQQVVTAIPVQATNLGPASGHESYDALSTEPTPSQVRTTETGGYGSANHQQHHHNHLSNHHHQTQQQHSSNGRQFPASGSRNHPNRASNVNNQNHLSDDGQLVLQSPYADPLADSNDLIDDIHTTRSSFANANNEPAYNHNKGGLGSANGGSQADQVLMSLQAPYGAMPTSPMNQLGQILMHNSNGKLVDSSSSILDSDDPIGGLYSRLQSTGSASNNTAVNSLTDAILRDYNIASALSNANSSNLSNQLLSSAMLANLIGSQGAESSPMPADPFNQAQQQPTPATPPANHHHHRGYSSAWPISVLLGDLLKLTTRPAQQLSNVLTGGGGDQSNRGSILQQSRLPGPLLSLLQGFTPNSAANNHELSMPSNHDASESSQHYHRVSMSPTDIHSILARSLSSSSVLPAYPAPKGTPQSWIPPTQGGSADFGLASNRNADLVASNVAGFVRDQATQTMNNINDQQNPHQQYPSSQQQQQDSYQRSSNDGSFFTQTGDGGQSNTGGQHLAQSNFNSGIIEQQQQLQPPVDQSRHQQTMFQGQLVSNPDRSWPASPSTGNGVNGAFALGGKQTGVGQSNNQENRLSATFKQQTNNLQNAPLLSQHDYSNYMNFHRTQNMANTGNNIQQPASFFNLATTSNMNGNIGQQVAHHKSASELPVPLGYNSPPNGASLGSQMDQSSLIPKMSLPSGVHSSITNIKQQSQPTRHLKQQVINQQGNLAAPIGGNGKTLKRRRRAVLSHTREDMGREDEVMSSKYNTNDEEDDGDSRPISVVRPDGRPMNSGRVRGYLASANQVASDGEKSHDRQVAQSQRSANHLDFKQRLLPEHHYSSLYGLGDTTDDDDERTGKLNELKRQNMMSDDQAGAGSLAKPSRPRDGHLSYKDAKQAFNEIRKGHIRGSTGLDTASSGLMSKLLGTASTNDEMEDDMDDDEDPASEKRKEELEDAEFGIVNDERQNSHRHSSDGPSTSPIDGPRHRPTEHGEKSSLRPIEAGDSGSGSTDNENYIRRHQPSPIEFYGHAGEETRQLKHGILGSGNYEVVNGGIYSEADESTAAVNSVANYIRKPILGNLPKLLAAGGGSSGGDLVDPQSAFMPGGRVAGFLLGASTNPRDEQLAGMMQSDLGKHLTSPLLELIDANTGEQLFDPNLLAQLGSSGSSARTTHASRETTGASQSTGKLGRPEGASEENEDGSTNRKQAEGRKGSRKNTDYGVEENGFDSSTSKIGKRIRNKAVAKDHQTNELANEEADLTDRPKSKRNKNRNREPNDELHSNRLEEGQQSSISGSKSQGTNQFNSYQILPSKKVTIFSDQDLDSAPSELLGTQTYQFPELNNFRRSLPVY